MGQKEKWDKYYTNAEDKFPGTCSVLEEYGYLLPKQGKALDLACGAGGNALYLARHGLQTTAVDISVVAVERLKERAFAHQLEISALQQDITGDFFSDNSFDVIVVSNYLDRTLFNSLQDALNPGGLLFYQTFVKARANPNSGPSSPDYLLDNNELLRLLPDLSVLVYLDLECEGDLSAGLRNQSCLVARCKHQP